MPQRASGALEDCPKAAWTYQPLAVRSLKETFAANAIITIVKGVERMPNELSNVTHIQIDLYLISSITKY